MLMACPLLLLLLQIILDLSLSNERLEVRPSVYPCTAFCGPPCSGAAQQPARREGGLKLPSVWLGQRENARLKQHMLDLRRAARACGCDLNATDADAAAAYPELGQLLRTADAAAVTAPVGDAAEGGARALAPVPAAEGLHIPERHRCALRCQKAGCQQLMRRKSITSVSRVFLQASRPSWAGPQKAAAQEVQTLAAWRYPRLAAGLKRCVDCTRAACCSLYTVESSAHAV